MKSWSFTIYRPPVSTNAALRMHWAKRNQLAKSFKSDAAILAHEAKIPRPLQSLARVTVTGVYPKRMTQADHDNLSLVRKWVTDGLVAGGFLIDDSPEYAAPGMSKSERGDIRSVRVLVEIVG